jgi:outer membrane protein assembly factor BamB
MLVVADRDKVVGINALSGKRQWVVPMQRPAQNTSAIFGGNHVFATDSVGKVTAIDPVGGKRLWEYAGRSPSNFLQVETGAEYIAVIGHSQVAVNFINQRGGAPAHPRILNVQPQPRAGIGPTVTVVTCISTATGKVTGEFRVDSSQDTQWQMTENDQLILVGNNFVRCYSPDSGKILWEAGFREGTPRFLAASEELAICAIDSQTKQDIVALDLETGKIRWRRALEDKGAKVFAITAVVQRDQVVISGALQTQNLTPQGGVMKVRRVVNQQGYTVVGPRIAAIGLSDGRARHVSKLSANIDDVNWQWIQSPVVTENQVITVVKQQMGAPKVTACINDANSGALLQEISVDDAAGNQPVALGGAALIRIGGAVMGHAQGFHSAGNAAVANGVLIIEGSNDIVTFSSGK